MKRLPLVTFLLLMFASAVPLLAKDNSELILLTDTTPAIDVLITMQPDTTGTISLAMAQAAVTVADANGTIIFAAADARLHALEFSMAPNSGNHTLTVKRLPGAAQAYVQVASLADLTIKGSANLVGGQGLTLNEMIAMDLNSNTPGGMTTVNIPEGTTGAITSTFAGLSASSQLLDSNGTLIAQSVNGHIDGVTFVLDAGRYDFKLAGRDLTQHVIAEVRVVPSEEGGFTVLSAPLPPVVAVPTTPAVVNLPVETCTATIAVSSANLRSGPGTGYSIVGAAPYNETLTVGGQNQESDWILVSSDAGSAWTSLGNAQLRGSCAALPVFNIPLYNAPAQIVTVPQTSNNSEGQGGEGEKDD